MLFKMDLFMVVNHAMPYGCSGFYNKDWKDVFYPKRLTHESWWAKMHLILADNKISFRETT